MIGPARTVPRLASASSSSNILNGYLTANSDYGDDYGNLTLLELPSQDTVPGPGQVQANFTTDTVVANQLALLREGETTVKQGNLLTLPVGGGLLYVQPVYVQATSETSFPLLRKVLVAFGDQIAFEDTLDLALDKLFGGDSGAEAGDGGTVTTPDPTDTSTPSPAPTDPATDPGTGDELADALADAKKALDERTAAYAANDLVAAAEADERLVDALTRALAASE